MKGRYLGLLVATIAIGVALTLAGGLTRSSARSAQPVSTTPRSMVEVRLRIEADGSLVPATVTVPKDARIALSITNGRGAPAQVQLLGYDDRLSLGRLEAGGTWTGAFVADRPGEDFAWLVDGKPAGRLVVAGSHLIEGHR